MPRRNNTDYDIGEAFAAIEDELMASMIRNMKKHRCDEVEEDKQWSMWQAEQLKALEKYRKENQKKFGQKFQDINSSIEELIRIARGEGEMQQEIEILNAIKKGFVAKKVVAGATAEFFRLNDRKLEALIKATKDDMERAETAVLRMADDQYRKVIFNAQVYANTGAGTYEKAVDMATEDFLRAGLNCVEYANGARHTLADYADMAIRTASKRAYLMGEGVKRKEWGISTVIMNKRGNPCPKCLPFVGKVLIDDVWSGGSAEDGPYPLMSVAVDAGLYHPRCKDSHTTYFEGVSTPPDDTYTKKEVEDIAEQNREEAKQQYAERQEKKFGRLAKYSLDEENQKEYQQKEKTWKNVRFRTGEMNSDEYVDSRDAKKMKGFVDSTEEWKKNATPNSHDVEEMLEYTVNEITYKVDGKHILMDYSDTERQVAEILKKEIGGKILMVPRVLSPQGVSTPDYIFRNEAYDLKTLSGSSKNLVYNAIAKKKKQASNFILDISLCPLSEKEIYKQIEYVYWSRHTMFVDKIILLKDGQVSKIFERNK